MPAHPMPVALAAAALAASWAVVPAAARPQGGLSGKIVYLHPGHGWTFSGAGWGTQRPETFEVVEDFTNQDFITFQAESLWNAGATVVPLRPIGRQTNEAVLDNDDPGVTFEGPWFDSGSITFFGDPGDVPYRFAFVSPAETAVATYRPDLPEAGVYPVYAWSLGGANRVEQLYRVNHTGGTTEVRVDHRRVGGGLVYLGSYYFDAGTGGSVEISNHDPGSSRTSSSVVIADMIRFGNGFGDIDRGLGVSGFPREDEAGLYWIEAHAGQGTPTSAFRVSSSDLTATVSAPPRWSAHMNLEGVGLPSDRVFLSHHSNAANTIARGVIALLNGNNNPASATPNQFTLALLLAAEINDDMVLQDGLFEHDWFDRSVLVLDRTDFEFGEITNTIIGGEFDATIVERAFHDNQTDAELLLDARANEAMARATSQGLIRYFNAVDGVTPVAFPPGRVGSLRAVPGADGSVSLAWSAPEAGPAAGDPATGYRVQVSPDGRGFADGLAVEGGATTGVTLDGLDPGLHYFRVVATNAAGWSLPSPVAAATASRGEADVLIVDGFDRLDRFMNPREPFGFGTIDRVRPRFSNSRDYAVEHAASITAAGAAVATAANEAVADGLVGLDGFPAVVWFLGEEDDTTVTLDADERAAIDAYLAGGGSLFISGTELAWDLGSRARDRDFLADTLGVGFLSDDASTYAVSGVPGTIFAGLDLGFDDGGVVYDADTPDAFTPTPGSTVVARYFASRSQLAAGVARATGAGGHVVTLGFPFEAILDPAARDAAMAAALELFGVNDGCPADLNGDGDADIADLLDFLGLLAAADTVADLDGDGEPNVFDLLAYLVALDEGCEG